MPDVFYPLHEMILHFHAICHLAFFISLFSSRFCHLAFFIWLFSSRFFQCRALTALYAFLAPLEDGSASEFVESFTEPLLRDVIVPAIQTEHDELQELGLALATVLAGVAGESFAPYYSDCMGAVTRILKAVRFVQRPVS